MPGIAEQCSVNIHMSTHPIQQKKKLNIKGDAGVSFKSESFVKQKKLFSAVKCTRQTCLMDFNLVVMLS